MKQFKTPEGTRDLIPSECKAKSELKQRIEQVFDRYGYDEVATPSIEFYQTYQTGFEEVKDEAMYKFFDHNGSILTLRMDMTVPIARMCASKLKDTQPPYRFRYCAEVFKVKEFFAGKRNEVSDCGIELIGLKDQESDLEVLTCAIEVMESLQQDDYTLEIGNGNFFLQACHDLNLSEEKISSLADLIDRKSMIELKTYLQNLNLNQKDMEFFLQLPLLCGKAEILKDAYKYCFNNHLKKILDQLQKINEALCTLGYGKQITYDLGKVPHLNYYSGILFEGYINGIGTSVLSGGRYDTLLEKFGVDLPAIGFSIKLDSILDVLDTTKKPSDTLVVCYPIEKQVEAIQKAQELRKTNRVKLLPQDRVELVVVEEDTL